VRNKSPNLGEEDASFRDQDEENEDTIPSPDDKEDPPSKMPSAPDLGSDDLAFPVLHQARLLNEAEFALNEAHQRPLRPTPSVGGSRLLR
jgi:hypothetical protein